MSEEITITDHNQSSRMLMLFGEVNEESSFGIVQGLLELQSENPMADITFLVNSPGGAIDDLFTIVDIMNCVVPDIKTVIIGKAMSAGAYIAINGTKGKRFMTENSRLMLHSVSGGIVGSYTDVRIEVQEMNRLNEKIVKLIHKNSHLTLEDARKLIERDTYILPEEALKLGLIDGIIDHIQ